MTQAALTTLSLEQYLHYSVIMKWEAWKALAKDEAQIGRAHV